MEAGEMNNMIGEIRRSSVIMSFAPGAIIDMRDGGGPVSVVSGGLESWDKEAPLEGNLKYQKIIERRLCRKLGKKYFRLPPVIVDGAKKPHKDVPDSSALVGVRFPNWLQCPICHVIRPSNRWDSEPGHAYRFCSECTENQPGKKKVFVVPVRFVTACTTGHLDEFPWDWWVRHKKDCKKNRFNELKLTSEGPGLAGLVVSCPACGARRSLDGIFRKDALSGCTCCGRRPWLPTDDNNCTCTPKDGSFRVVQRGASNLYYPLIDSALDIPPWTRRLEQELGDCWDILANIPSCEDRVGFIKTYPPLKSIMERAQLSPEGLASRFEEMLNRLDGANPEEIRLDEYRLFTSGKEEMDNEFEIHQEETPENLSPLLSRITRVARLREVRVVRGFTRITPPLDPDGAEIAPLSAKNCDWLPAIEVRGEGVFFQLEPGALTTWENLEVVKERCRLAEVSWQAEWKQRNPGRPAPFPASPRLLLLHTFAHGLIRQLTLECGYPSASLRERLYVSEASETSKGMAGVLIYTATPDSEGTLGGLQRRAMTDLAGPTVTGAVLSMRWCSSDPLCINGEMAVPESHSLASCHCCTMVPETSCEFHNRFLDRALLVGTDEHPDLGYFRAIFEAR